MSETRHDRRVKTALDETRLLIPGAQILFGFHLNGDLYVAVTKALDAPIFGAAAALVAALMLAALWLVQPLVLRARAR